MNKDEKKRDWKSAVTYCVLAALVIYTLSDKQKRSDIANNIVKPNLIKAASAIVAGVVSESIGLMKQ